MTDETKKIEETKIEEAKATKVVEAAPTKEVVADKPAPKRTNDRNNGRRPQRNNNSK